jgi:hypothetical protein
MITTRHPKMASSATRMSFWIRDVFGLSKLVIESTLEWEAPFRDELNLMDGGSAWGISR